MVFSSAGGMLSSARVWHFFVGDQTYERLGALDGRQQHIVRHNDTEHTLFVAQALLTHPDDPVAFQRCLAWKLRLWLLGLPAGLVIVDEVSMLVRRVFDARGIVGGELRGGVGYDQAREGRLWRAGELSTADYLLQLKQTLDTALAGAELEGRLWRRSTDYLAATGQLESWLGWDGATGDLAR